MSLTFVTPDDLRARTQNTGLSDPTCQSAIDSAVGLVESLTRVTLDFVQGNVIELVGGGPVLTLPGRPVVVDMANPFTVVELSASGVAFPLAEGVLWYRQDNRLVRVQDTSPPWTVMSLPGWAMFRRPAGVWGPRVRVTYSHGYRSVSELPPGLVPIILGAAVDLVTNPGMLREEKVGEVAVTYGLESMRTHGDLIDELRDQLRAIGLRRGGAFSVGSA